MKKTDISNKSKQNSFSKSAYLTTKIILPALFIEQSWLHDAPRIGVAAKVAIGQIGHHAPTWGALDEALHDEERLIDLLHRASIIDKFHGGPVGITTIATAIGEDAGTIEEVYEPFLIMEGFIKRTPRGRMVTELAYRHFGRNPYSGNIMEPSLFE